jgi:tRNA-dihydrouridine synthase B
MAEAARINADRGAQIIDINMGCPAKKVCNKAAGSALLRDERRVGEILDAVVRSVDVPVTLKIRTGWDAHHRNAETIARIAEQSGIQAITVHGRTRACGFSGEAEYRTIHAVKRAVGIPVIANGDIDSPQKARDVIRETGADAVMVGRAALGRPWIFGAMSELLDGHTTQPAPVCSEIRDVILEHLQDLYAFYGEHQGVRITRKHVGWYFDHLSGPMNFRPLFNRENSAARQLSLIASAFDDGHRIAPA